MHFIFLKIRPIRHLEYDLVRFNAVDNEFETIFLSNNYIITGVMFVSLDDYHDYQGSTCYSASDERLHHFDFMLLLVQR